MISYDVTTFGRPLERIERDAPVPQGMEVLLKVRAAGVCHTDIHTWHGWYDLGGGKRLTMADRGVSVPLTLGHEIVGDLVASGPDAAPLPPGRSYLVYPWIGCGTCRVCARGQEQLCPAPRFLGIFRPGGYSDHVLVPDARYLIDIGDLSPAQAAPYACSGLTTYSAIRKIVPMVLKEERIVIIGAGGLGLMAVSLLQALGSAGAIVVEPNAARREAALAAGAAAAIDSSAHDAAAQIKQAAGGAVWAVIDCVGAASTVQLALDMLVKGGQLIQVGLFGGEIMLPTPIIPIRALSLVGSYVGSLTELRELMALVEETNMVPVPTSCRCLHEAGKALDDLEQGNVIGRIILQP
jgi:propanol-preferring alcohol dehydrogenase